MKVVNINWQKAMPIRHLVLWPNEAPEFCYVEGDEDAQHFGVLLDGDIICVASIYLESVESKLVARLRKFATLPSFQGKGAGSFMLENLVHSLKQQGVNYLWFDARESALNFYQRFGFSVKGERFYKNTVPYFKMHANL